MEDRVLYHAKRSSLLGKEREGHKYFARVLVKQGSGGKPNQYRYFYNNKDYMKYMQDKSKSAIDKPKKQEESKQKTSVKTSSKSSSKKDPESIINDIFSKKMVAGVISKGKYVVEGTIKKLDEVKDKLTQEDRVKKEKTEQQKSNKQQREKQQEKSRKVLEEKTHEMKEFDEKHKAKLKKIEETQKQRKEEYEHEEAKRRKTIVSAKPKFDRDKLTATLPNGETKKFDNVDEYDDYISRLAHQKNEPEFMKNVPKIDPNKVFTKFEDQEKINELFAKGNKRTTTNCANCSVAYELRRRGYDVEAVTNGGQSDYNGKHDRYYDYFENAKVVGIKGDGDTIAHSEKYLRDLCNGDGKVRIQSKEDKAQHEFRKAEYTYTVESLTKGITDNSPPGSRGMVSVQWKDGGGHSIMYEVDTKGNVVIRDSQTYDEYSLDELADLVKRVTICRTDNLELKEDILKAVKPNEDKERKYYVDERYIMRYIK